MVLTLEGNKYNFANLDKRIMKNIQEKLERKKKII